MPADPEAEGAIRTRAVFRYTVGVTLAVAISQGVAWRLSYIAPVLVCPLLLSPTALTLSAGLQFVAVIAVALLFGWLATTLLLPYPLVCVLAVAFLLFWIFYLARGGLSAFVVTMLLIAITVLPVVGQQSLALVREVAVGLAIAGVAAVVITWVAFALVPPPAGAAAAKTGPEPGKTPTEEERLRAALRTSAVIVPLQMAYLVFGWTSLIVLMFAALLAQQPDARAGIEGAKGMLLANLVGGAAAIAAYNLLVAVPSFVFLVALTFLLALLFADRIFRPTPTSALFASAFSASLILIGSSVTPFGGEADAKFYQRFIQVMLAGCYVAAAFYLLPARAPNLRPHPA